MGEKSEKLRRGGHPCGIGKGNNNKISKKSNYEITMKGEGDGERQQGNSERKIIKGEGNEGALSFRKPQIFAFFQK